MDVARGDVPHSPFLIEFPAMHWPEGGTLADTKAPKMNAMDIVQAESSNKENPNRHVISGKPTSGPPAKYLCTYIYILAFHYMIFSISLSVYPNSHSCIFLPLVMIALM